MESFLNRYRNITVLLLVLCAQLVLLAVQVKNDQDVRMIRVWTVTAVTPAARIIEGLRGGGLGFLRNYVLLRDTNQENKRLQSEVDRLKIENHFLKTQLSTADRVKALSIFQEHTASRTVAATIIGTGAGTNSKVVFIDRGTAAGVQRGMAVVTPDGIVGKVISSYPTASEVLLITDPDFAAGVISQKTQIRGTLKGQGSPLCKLDYVPVEEKIEAGEMLYTSGDDRIFPKGFPVGVIKVVRNATPFKEILVSPAGMEHGLEEVLVLLEGVHQAIPETPPVQTQVYLTPPPPAPAMAAAAQTSQQGGTGTTEADRLRQHYKAIGEAQNHTYGDNPPGAKVVDFNAKPGSAPAARPAAGPAPTQTVPAAPATAQPRGTAPSPGPAAAPLRAVPPNSGSGEQRPRTGIPPAPTRSPSGVPGGSGRMQNPGAPPAVRPSAPKPAEQPARPATPRPSPGAIPDPPDAASPSTRQSRQAGSTGDPARSPARKATPTAQPPDPL